MCVFWNQWSHFQNVLFLNRQINSLGSFSVPESFNFSWRLANLGQGFRFRLWNNFHPDSTVTGVQEGNTIRVSQCRENWRDIFQDMDFQGKHWLALAVQWKGEAPLQRCDSSQVHLSMSLEIFPKPSQRWVWDIKIITGTVPGLLQADVLSISQILKAKLETPFLNVSKGSNKWWTSSLPLKLLNKGKVRDSFEIVSIVDLKRGNPSAVWSL